MKIGIKSCFVTTCLFLLSLPTPAAQLNWVDAGSLSDKPTKLYILEIARRVQKGWVLRHGQGDVGPFAVIFLGPSGKLKLPYRYDLAACGNVKFDCSAGKAIVDAPLDEPLPGYWQKRGGLIIGIEFTPAFWKGDFANTVLAANVPNASSEISSSTAVTEKQRSLVEGWIRYMGLDSSKIP